MAVQQYSQTSCSAGLCLALYPHSIYLSSRHLAVQRRHLVQLENALPCIIPASISAVLLVVVEVVVVEHTPTPEGILLLCMVVVVTAVVDRIILLVVVVAILRQHFQP